MKADYGIDAPPVIRNLALAALASLVLATGLLDFNITESARFSFRPMGICMAVSFALSAGAMIWSSKVGKIRSRVRFMNMLTWHGDEQVLDVGCGRGLFLIEAARRLTTGKAIGVDIWQKADLSGNHPDRTRENAQAEGVADRVEVQDGDARALPFPDATFDKVVSSVALHNIYDANERNKAIAEIARVLKPGGQVLIVDIRHTPQYQRVLAEYGVGDLRRTWASPFALPIMMLTFGSLRGQVLIGRKAAQ
jgi:ubiquinone/menaquinone biosynthesis C-methylase UbiE